MEVVFERPLYLIFLASLPLLVVTHFYFLRHTKRKAMKFANFEAMRRVTATGLVTKNWRLLFLRLAVLTCLVLAVATPVLWVDGNVSHSDYVLAIDASASMTSEDVYPNRLNAAKQAATAFLDSLDAKAEVGVITFAGISYINQVPTSDKARLKKAVQGIDTIPAGGTDIGSALINSVNLLQGTKSKKIVLLTDGSDTAGFAVDDGVDLALEYVRANHVIVYTIGIGTPEGGKGNLPESLRIAYTYNEGSLSRIAQGTGGAFFEAQDMDGLITAFSSIGSDSDKGKIPHELGFGLLVAGLVLLYVEWGLINTRFRFVP